VEFTEKEELVNQVSKTARTKPQLISAAGKAAIPVMAALGFALVPSRRLAAHAVGSVVTGVVGAVTKDRLDAATKEAALVSIAQAVIQYGVKDPSASALIDTYKDEYALSDEDFKYYKMMVYVHYLIGMVKYNFMVKTSEIVELAQLRQTLKLDHIMIGEAHCRAAMLWYNETVEESSDPYVFFDSEHPDTMAMDKFLFLSERSLNVEGETMEAFTYEFSRICSVFHLGMGEASDRVSSIAVPFYKTALQNTKARLGDVETFNTMLKKARNTLGISDEVGNYVHMETYVEEMHELLGSVNEEGSDRSFVAFDDAIVHRLKLLQDTMGLLTDKELQDMITKEFGDEFRVRAFNTLKTCIRENKSEEETHAELECCRKDLNIVGKGVGSALETLMTGILNTMVTDCVAFADAVNKQENYALVSYALNAKKLCLGVLKAAGAEIGPNSLYAVEGIGFKMLERMYGYYVDETLRMLKEQGLEDEDDDTVLVTKEIMENLKDVQELLQVNDVVATEFNHRIYAPAFRTVLLSSTKECMLNVDVSKDKIKGEIEEAAETYLIDEPTFLKWKRDYYKIAAEMVKGNSPGGIPSEENHSSLKRLAWCYDLEDTHINDINGGLFGSVYAQGVKEALGITGIVPKDIAESLNELRQRLGVSEPSAKIYFANAIKQRLLDQFVTVKEELERFIYNQQQLAQRDNKDPGEDVFRRGKGGDEKLGIRIDDTILLGDIMALIAMFKDNNMMEMNSDGVWTAPITAIDSNVLNAKQAELIFRQFIVSGFQKKEEDGNTRYEDSMDLLGAILGMSEESMLNVKDNIGGIVFENYINQILSSKGKIDQQDMMYLSNIQKKLELPDEVGSRLLQTTQVKKLTEEAIRVKRSPDFRQITAFREKVMGMGMELRKHCGLAEHERYKMFRVELTGMLRSNMLGGDDREVVQDMQDNYELDAERCGEILEELVDNNIRSSMARIIKNLDRNSGQNVVNALPEFLEYVNLIDGEIDLDVEENKAKELMDIFSRMDTTDEEPRITARNEAVLLKVLKLA